MKSNISRKCNVKVFWIVICSLFTITAAKGQIAKDSLQTDSISSKKLLEEVIVTSRKNRYNVQELSASLRIDGKLQEVPQNIQILNNQLLSEQQLYTMSDAIARNVSGANKLEGWGDMYTYITMRGARAAAFRNGMSVSGMYGVLSEDMSFVDRVEFVKGPAGFMLSNGEPSGIYNIVTKRPSGTPKGNFSFGLGSYGLYRTTLDLDGLLNKRKTLQYRLNVAGQTNNAFRNYESTKRWSVAPVLTYQLDKKTSLTVEYIFQYASMPDLGVKYLFSKTGYGTVPRQQTLADPGIEQTVVHDQNIHVNLQHVLNDNWRITAQVSYFDYNQQGSFIWIRNINNTGHMQRYLNIWDANNKMRFGQVFVNGKHRTGPIEHKLLAGLDLSSKSYVADFVQSYNMDSIGTFNIYKEGYQKPYYGTGKFDRSIDVRRRIGTGFLLESHVAGLYVQDDLGFFHNRLHLTLAGRYTYVKDNNYGTISENRKFTPRVGLSYAVADALNIYALYDQAFLPQTGKLRSGKSVKPLTGNNFELGIKKDWWEGSWNTSLSLYRIMKENQLSADPDNGGGENYVLQFGQTKTQGVEFDLKGTIFKGMYMIANYAFTDSKITESTSSYKKGTQVPGSAKHSGNILLNYQFQSGVLKNLGLSGSMSYMADRQTWWTGDLNGESLPDYCRFDAGISWHTGPLRLDLNIYNILDTYLYNGSHHSSGWYYWRPEPPRNFRFGMAYSF
ncbi:TonB-dependent siderophore receptor [Chitinophaga nivalis]|uniref:TonB-dependent siderophore receptor n=1 Tax=Chitinophaga nivalis TaxID=2991709 RepID=A0ABT3INK1_9BACT|nr:TonB-dependent siderophore receptor [Chitinophaga nivalis]MCW3464787.1 TonB-dependent siderophore receptor [Chitinophaga nivalis]MCW3485522.1 TonB-dependent siderophore receptor [Chitinophaga nivalis]